MTSPVAARNAVAVAAATTSLISGGGPVHVPGASEELAAYFRQGRCRRPPPDLPVRSPDDVRTTRAGPAYRRPPQERFPGRAGHVPERRRRWPCQRLELLVDLSPVTSCQLVQSSPAWGDPLLVSR